MSLQKQALAKNGNIVKAGRAWWRPSGFNGPVLHWEWSFEPRIRAHAALKFNGEGCDIGGVLGLPFFFLYVALANIFPRKYRGYEHAKELGINFHDGIIWINLFREEFGDYYGGKRAKTRLGSWWWKLKKNREITIHVVDILLGQSKHSEKEILTCEIAVPMPEELYKGICVMKDETWKRPRWFPKTIRRAHIEMVTPVPFPGKGENSYDCGDDALHGMTCPAETPEEAAIEVSKSVWKSRLKYGGPNWRPPKKEKQA